MMIGRTVAHYKIVEQLGEGGMGVVYKAEDTKLHRTVALKFLSSESLATGSDRERFAAEARAAASLDHPNICTIYEINEFEGQSFIAMAYVEGRSLHEEIDEGPVDINRAIDLAAQVAKGLSAAHEKGIVHRDIKSANIMVTPKGDAKIMDFGIAHRAGATLPDDEVTTAGTLAYSSPEQLRGEAVDRRSDVWSLGATLYEMITGRAPFRGDYPSAMAYAIQSEPPEPMSAERPEVPAALERIVNRALAKSPDDRYQSAEEMYEDLRALQIERDPTISKVLSGIAGAPAAPWYKQILTGRTLVAAGVYLGLVYAAVRLTGWLVSHYVWSPHLTGIVALALLSLLPTVLLVAGSKARGAGRSAQNARNIGVPVNLVASVALVFAFFAGKDLGAATTTVSVTNEEGVTVERVVPKQQFRKKTAVFFFDNDTGDSTLTWLRYGIPAMMQLDLYQDPFVVFRSGFEPAALSRLKRSGFLRSNNTPVPLLQKIAGELYADYFLTGSYSRAGGKTTVHMTLRDTETGNPISDRTISNADIFALADDMSVTLKRDLGVPEGHIGQVKDLPISEVMTNSEPAMKDFVLGWTEFLINNDSQTAIESTERAVAEDSTFAVAWLALYSFYRLDNRVAEAGKAIDNVMNYLYKLPERQQYMAKSIYYDNNQEPDRQLAVLEMLVELYPDDLDARALLANAYTYRNETDKAVEQIRSALKIDPYNFDLVGGLVDLLVDQAKFDEARDALEAYSSIRPDDAAALVKLGELEETRGDLDAARRAYDRALIINTTDTEVLLKLSAIEIKTGRFQMAQRHCDEALRLSKTAQERFRVYEELADYYEIRGQQRLALSNTEKMMEEGDSWLPPLQSQFVCLSNLDRYVQAGRSDRAFALLDSIRGLIAPPLDMMASLGAVKINLALERPEAAAVSLEELEKAVDALQLHMLDNSVRQKKGEIRMLEGDYEGAIGYFTEWMENDPSSTEVHLRIGECQRLMGRFGEARESLEKRLATHPMDPKAHYQLALVYSETGDMGKALEHLQKALEVWDGADRDFEPAAKAREKLKEWRSATSM
ncbi:MAG: protein kinase [Candidatus Latescibacterota bacterium]|jgi:tetratricopeptide (TPR) repeat protein/tRNA A-37 threonylcarbamoyl transferase component Bud32/TolB-like protein